ncbi:MAG: protein-disulfide reductase DsbD domain-containing protein [Paracoccaceae bacterium]
MRTNYTRLIFLTKTNIIFFLLFIIISILSAPNVFGNQNYNSFKNDYVEISFINAWETKQGNLFALFIKMKENWKTYWRYPGDSGFAPELKLLSDKNLKKIKIYWPTPKVFYENETIINGYKKDLTLPILFLKNNNESQVEFEIELKMGFCEDICIPIKLFLNSKYAFKSSEKLNKMISQSLKNTPKELLSSKKLVTCDVKKIGNSMTLISKLDDNFFSKKKYIDHLILEYKDDQIWFSEIKKLSNKDYTAQIKSIEEENFLLDKSKIKYTIITKSGGFQKNGCKSN